VVAKLLIVNQNNDFWGASQKSVINKKADIKQTNSLMRVNWHVVAKFL